MSDQDMSQTFHKYKRKGEEKREVLHKTLGFSPLWNYLKPRPFLCRIPWLPEWKTRNWRVWQVNVTTYRQGALENSKGKWQSVPLPACVTKSLKHLEKPMNWNVILHWYFSTVILQMESSYFWPLRWHCIVALWLSAASRSPVICETVSVQMICVTAR